MKYGISLGNSKLGRLAIDHLMDKGVAPADIVAVIRTPAKADDLALRGVVVRRGEYGDEPSLVEALQGVDKLYMVSGMAPPEERRRQHRGVIESAKDAGVRCVIYTSFIDTAEDSPFFAWSINRDTETVLKASGLCHTILRNGMYVEADLDYIPEYVTAGKIANNIADGRISYISRRDLALAAVHCLLDAGHDGKTYTLTGPEAVTQARLAEWISQWTGKAIPYVPMTDDEYRDTFPEPHWAEVVVTLYESVRLGNAEAVTEDFETIVGRKAWSVPEVYDRFYR